MEDKSAKILLDVPVEDGVLGFGNYRDALNSIIKNSEPHFTIGIFGGWGTGKTTLMRMMRRELDRDGEITVWFNPWQYEKENLLLIPLLLTLKLELETNHQGLVSQERLARIKSILKSVVRIVRPELGIGFAKVGLNGEKLFEETQEDLTSTYFELHRELRELIDTIKEKGRNRIVIFVDDLDRCLPDKALETLESVKGFLDMDGYVFVLGLSREIIEKCVDAKYGSESGISGSEYLRKMIQVPFNLPDLRAKEIEEYVERVKEAIRGSDAEEHIERYIDIIARGLEPNPREIKRFVNNFILANRISGEEAKPEELLTLLIIQFRWENFYRDLAKYKNPFLEQTREILKALPSIRKGRYENGAQEKWSYYDLIENHLKDNELANFLQKAGGLLFGISDLASYIHFSKSVVIEEEHEKEAQLRELIYLLSKGRIKEFNEARPYPIVRLTSVRLSGIDLGGVDLSRADLNEAHLSGSTLTEADLSKADLGDANLTDATLSRASMSGANLTRADLTRADLGGADLRRARLAGAALVDAFLGSAELAGADLRGANLSGASLSSADLHNVSIDRSTVFEYTDITHARNLSSKITERLHVETQLREVRATSKWH